MVKFGRTKTGSISARLNPAVERKKEEVAARLELKRKYTYKLHTRNLVRLASFNVMNSLKDTLKTG